MLERIEYTVKHASSSFETEGSIIVPPFKYNLLDFLMDFWENPGGVAKVGGSQLVDEYPSVEPCGDFSPPKKAGKIKVALIGYSMGGFISRAYLSNRPYGGKAYKGNRFVHTLVTLGTPHKNAPGAMFESVKWCNGETLPVRGLAVGSKGSPGYSLGHITQSGYAICSGKGDGCALDGDGVTTLESSLAWVGDRVEQMILEGVTHYPWSNTGILGQILAPELVEEHRNGKPWYGDEIALDRWATFLLEQPIQPVD